MFNNVVISVTDCVLSGRLQTDSGGLTAPTRTDVDTAVKLFVKKDRRINVMKLMTICSLIMFSA